MMSGAESVRAMKPSVAVVVSGVSAALTLTAGAALGELAVLVEAVLEPELQPCAMSVLAAATLEVMMNCRLEKLVIRSSSLVPVEIV